MYANVCMLVFLCASQSRPLPLSLEQVVLSLGNLAHMTIHTFFKTNFLGGCIKYNGHDGICQPLSLFSLPLFRLRLLFNKLSIYSLKIWEY